MLRFASSLFLIAIALAGLACPKLEAIEFTEPANRFGAADLDGFLKVTGHFGAIQLDEALYPVFFFFTSDPQAEHPFFGTGFRVPLLESTLIDHDYYLEGTTFGGQTVFLYRKDNAPQEYASSNGRWTARKTGKNAIERTSPDGFTTTYVDGIARKLKTPDGDSHEFLFEDGKCYGLEGRFECQDGTRLPNGVDPVKGKLMVEGKPLKIVLAPYDGDPDGLAEGGTALAAIDWGDGKKSLFLRTPRPGGGAEITMHYDDQRTHFVWDGRGRLMSRNGVRYEFGNRPVEDDDDSPGSRKRRAESFTVTRKYPDGTVRTFSRDVSTGIIRETLGDGVERETYLIKATGPAFHKIRKVVEDSERVYQAYYDSKGRLIRELRPEGSTYHVYEGNPFDTMIIEDDDIMLRYDHRDWPARRLTRKSDTAISYSRNGTRREVTKYRDGSPDRIVFVDQYGIAREVDASGKPVEPKAEQPGAEETKPPEPAEAEPKEAAEAEAAKPADPLEPAEPAAEAPGNG